MKTVLIVDDDQQIQSLLSELFRSRTGYKTVVAEDGEAARDLIETSRPDLILVDILMPRLGGMALFSDIRCSKATKDIPVIFMSGELKHEVFQKEGIDMGAVDYITKPIDFDYLLKKIKNIFNE